jgi:flavin-binding protein dodecin
MLEHTYKIIDIVGSSSVSTDEAIRNAIKKASTSVRHINWFQVVETRGSVSEGKVTHFQVILKLGFRLDE